MSEYNSTLPVDVTDEAMAADATEKQENNYQEKTVFDVKNYLDTKIPDGASEKKLTIRLLPFPETKSPFLHIHMHNVKVPTEIAASGFKSYVCLRKTDGFDKSNYGGDKCPFCELNQSAYQDFQKETDPTKKDFYKKLSLQNIPREAVIMRCIERGAESDGVKFWKVNVNQDKGDAYNLIKTLYETRKQEWLADPENAGKDPSQANILSWKDYGYDLIITFKTKEEINKKTGKKETKKSVQVTDAKKPTPLSTNMEQVKAWIGDPKKWYEVFVPKHYDYTALILQGKTPFFDKSVGKWVSKEEHAENENKSVEDAEKQIMEAQRIATGVAKPADNTQATAPAVSVFEDDGIPF